MWLNEQALEPIGVGLVPIRQPAARSGLGAGGRSSCQAEVRRATRGGAAGGSAAAGPWRWSSAPRAGVVSCCGSPHASRPTVSGNGRGCAAGRGGPSGLRKAWAGATGHLGDPAISGHGRSGDGWLELVGAGPQGLDLGAA